jgi:hypothetical protein
MSQAWTCPFTSEPLHVSSLNLSIYIRTITCPKSEPVHLHQNHYMSQAWTCPFTSEPLHVSSLNLSIYIRTITCLKSEPVHLHQNHYMSRVWTCPFTSEPLHVPSLNLDFWPYVVVFMFNELRQEVIACSVDICEIFWRSLFKLSFYIICVLGVIICLSFYDFSIRSWNCSNSMAFLFFI